MSELKPCPFCGGIPETGEVHIGVPHYHIECSCGIRTARYPNYGALVEFWNTRPVEDALRRRIAELEWLAKDRI